MTGWKIDIKNSTEYDQASEDAVVAELISQREQEEALQQEAEERLAAEQAARAEEDARLRELYPLPEDEEDYPQEEGLPGDDLGSQDQLAEEQSLDNAPSDEEVQTVSDDNSEDTKAVSTEAGTDSEVAR